MKNILRTGMLCLVALIIAAASGLASYIITLKILNKEISDNRMTAKELQMPPVSVSAQAETEMFSEKKNQNGEFNFYTVKLEDDMLNVYVNYEKHEELLYGEKINIWDLSEEDKKMLMEGVRLEGMSEVTSLTENFTS